MNVLKKILEEINEKIKFAGRMIVEKPCDKLDEIANDTAESFISAYEECSEIIRSHMDEIQNCEGCSRRKWYQKGFEDGKKDSGWIPVEDRLPEESLNSVIGWDEYRKRCCFVQYYCGRWILGNDVDSVKITAWQPLPEPYIKNPK